MTDAGAVPKLKPSEWLDDAELKYRPRMRTVSLVVEANYTERDATMALEALGRRYLSAEKNGLDPAGLWSRWPATGLVALAGAGAVLSTPTEFWPHVCERMKLQNTPSLQGFLGQGFRRALARFGLPCFDHIPRKNLGPILMHGGVPNSSLGDLVELIVSRRAREPGLTARDFVSWGLEPGLEGRLLTVGKPVRYFLENGDEFALDVIDRLFDVIDDVSENPKVVSEKLLTAESTGLPSVMVNKFCRLVELGDVDLEPVRHTHRSRRAEENTPRIVLDLEATVVQVALPSVAGHSSVSWELTADRARWVVDSRALWVEADQTPPTAFTVPGPLTRIRVENSAGTPPATLSLVETSDPLVLFDQSGAIIPRRTPAPRGPVWALYPTPQSDDSGLPVDANGELLPVLREDNAPEGWAGWSLVCIDTDSAASVQLQGRSTPPRRVRRDQLPAIDLGEPLVGVTTVAGHLIYPSRPTLVLPAEPGEVMWRVEITREDATEPLGNR